MTPARAVPMVILVLLVGGISLFFLSADREEETAAEPAGPLVRLAPALRGLEAASDRMVPARALVDGVLEQHTNEPKEAILEALESPDWGAQWAGLLAIPRYGESDTALAEALLPLLEADAAVVRSTAATASGYVGTNFEILLPGLERACGDPRADVRMAALSTLARRSARYPRLLVLFTNALEDVEDGCRAQAARGIAQVELREALGGAELERMVGALAAALTDRSREVRMYAAMALGRAGPAAASEVAGILSLIRDPDPLVNGQAATALGSIGVPALPALREALGQAPVRYAPSLLWALRLMGEPAVPLLQETLRHESVLVRVLAAEKLFELERGTEAMNPVVLAALASAERATLRAGIRLVDRTGTGDAEVLRALERLTDHDDAVIAHEAGAAARRLREALEPK